ncbi:dihydrolipoamide acetyltransferase family protein [Bradyrhizobium sp.]|jgi:2-oxoisovalerate dehydrogenase E2 component (dihydrolipoyl transacylase)|uniref:dihydrolipoamide acetyltransferase family protein n=1 Tax=Bradyrhizobium sp. TaxID=376 RepID=UPI002DDDACAB|nr:dihydrolipoamide acetyltransferase family protein [Bradyrhizobium sp.]HEV2157682.1 dihydrolipoamide acetyltransferase family protein [Bradyrhizobium sp.]
MGERSVKLPDIGEGIAEAELVEWHVKQGDLVREDDLLATVMTDKASVEIPSPLAGEVVWIGAQIGDAVAIGSTLVKLKVAGDDAAESKDETPTKAVAAPPAATKAEPAAAAPSLPARIPAAIEAKPMATAAVRRAPGEKPLASPAVRLKAREAGIDLRQVQGSGPAGRITHEDIDAFLSRAPVPAHGRGLSPKTAVTDVKVVGLRRRIAEKMALSKSRIPHITIIEEVNVSPLEELRATLNKKPAPEQPKLTLLPFLMRAMAKALAEQPALNALYDDEAGIVHQHAGIHIGIATQTPSGLVVPVVKHVEARDLRDCSIELNRLAQRAREGTATREELTGSTITITSLGALGGLATTPVINHPEVTIVGVNKIAVRPLWDGTQFVPCKMMNLSSSFDHRVIDGWDAAIFVQRLRELLENPATIFVDP